VGTAHAGICRPATCIDPPPASERGHRPAVADVPAQRRGRAWWLPGVARGSGIFHSVPRIQLDGQSRFRHSMSRSASLPRLSDSSREQPGPMDNRRSGRRAANHDLHPTSVSRNQRRNSARMAPETWTGTGGHGKADPRHPPHEAGGRADDWRDRSNRQRRCNTEQHDHVPTQRAARCMPSGGQSNPVMTGCVSRRVLLERGTQPSALG
jgi:hypothetical protein